MTTSGSIIWDWKSTRMARLLALLICATAVALIVHTYGVFDQIYDEAPHIGPGMEWLVDHTYTLDRLNSPLPRAVIAIGPYLLGGRPHQTHEPTEAGNDILNATVNRQGIPVPYHHILVAARLGTLTFFLFAMYLIWSRARDWLGEWPAVVALLLFCTCEPILGHSSVATTDISVMAMYFWAIDRIWRLAKQPSLKNSLMMGLAAGVALVCKHSAAPFLVFALMLFALVHWFVRRKDSVLRVLRPKYWVPSALLAFFIVWGMYFFTIGPLFPAGGEDAQKLTAMLERRHIPVRPVFAVLDHVPAPGYLGGIRDTRAANHNALKTSYFMGRVRYGGDRFFFLVALLVKTPIPFLLLGLTGVFFAVRSLLQREQSYSAAMLVGMTSPFIITSVSHINMGLRHELVVYPFLTLLGAMAVKKLWEKGIVLRSIIILLLVWESVACLAASPEYLTYFNEAASAHADYFLIDSDVDWGQDLKRLPAALDKLSATNVAIAYFGTDDPARVMGKRQWHVMQPDERHGWFVVSDFFLKMHPEEYGWLAQPQYKPVVVGRSLFIFHIQ